MKTFKEAQSQPECNTGFGGAPEPNQPTYVAEDELLEDESGMLGGARFEGTLRSRG
jgi:hypothetical protein